MHICLFIYICIYLFLEILCRNVMHPRNMLVRSKWFCCQDKNPISIARGYAPPTYSRVAGAAQCSWGRPESMVVGDIRIIDHKSMAISGT